MSGLLHNISCGEALVSKIECGSGFQGEECLQKARQEIERDILSRYEMEKVVKNSGEYILSIPYTTDEELDESVNAEIWAEAAHMADLRHCFIEGDTISLKNPDRYW